MKPAISRSTVMQAAWKLVKAGATLSTAMLQAWKEARIRAVKEALTVGFLWITFRKVNGAVCTKKATRRLDLIPDPDKPKGGGSAAGSPAVLAFYSETDHAWRSFRTDNLLTFKAA